MIDFKLIDDSEELNLQLLDDNEEIKLEMTDYDDTEVKEMIDEVDNRVDNLSAQVNQEINDIKDDIDELDGRIRINTNNISNLQQNKADKSQVNALSTQVQANTIQIGQNKADITALNNRVEQIPIVTKTSQLTNDSGYITKNVNNLTYYTTTANLSRVALTGNYNDLTNKPDLSNFATKTELNSEATNRENADIGLQGQIDAITSSSDVKDIVGTYAELQNYDTSTLGNDDIIKVLQDSTHNEAMTYYRWIISGVTGSWQYVGQEGPYYTKSETETLLNNKQDEITSSSKLLSDLVDDANQTNKFVTENEKTTWNIEIENLHEEDELLKRNLQTTTGSGEEVTLYKTAKLDFVKPPLPRGNTEQDTTTGKNVLNTIDANTTTTNGVTYYRNKGVYYLSGTNTKTSAVWVLPNTQNTNLPIFEAGQTYTMSVKGTLPNGIYAQLNAIKTSTGTQYNLGTIKNTVPSATFTIDSDYARTAQLFIGVQTTATNVDCNFSIQIEKGSTATSYEPYTGGIPSPNPDYPQEVKNVTGNVEVIISNKNNTESKTLPVSLGNIELCKIGNYQDYLYKNNGKWYLHKEIKKILLNGTERWSISNNVFYLTSISDYINSSEKICLSDKYTAINNTSVGTSAITQNNSICFFITNTNPRLYIRDERFNNVNAFKAELSENNVKVYYPTVTPTYTEITDTTLISQLEEISKTLSYQEQTNITSNTIAMFDVEAYQDLKIILDEKYTKPSGGIPKTDLASTVQTSLGKADTAVQPSDLSTVATSGNYNDLSNKPTIPKYYHGTSTTAAATRLKVVECEGFVLEEGATISVTFTNAQTYNGSPQLNVNGTGAIVVQYKQGTAGIRYMWSVGEIIDFTYNGEYWVCHGRALATTSYYGVTKLATGANSDSQAYALTPRSLYYFANYSIAPYYSGSKTYAVGDKVRYTYYIYECTTKIDTPESWNAEHWQIVDPLQAQIDALEARIKALENS